MVAFAALCFGIAGWTAWRAYRTPGNVVEGNEGDVRKPWVYTGALVIGLVGLLPAGMAVRQVYWITYAAFFAQTPFIEGQVMRRSIGEGAPPRYFLHIGNLPVEVSADIYHATRDGEQVRIELGKTSVRKVAPKLSPP